MSIVDKREDLDATIGVDGQQKSYLVLPEEERRMGFVRPLRTSYRHVGAPGPAYPLRDLTPEEKERYKDCAYVKYEVFPKDQLPMSGRFWTQYDLDRTGKGCGATTSMGLALSETYARNPSFYSGTFCVRCGGHFPVGADGEFVWESDGQRVGT